MRILIAKNGEGVKATDNLVEIRNELKNPESLVWVDLNSDSIEDCRRILTDEFKFHPLSVDDALVETHIPKIDDWEDYLYLSLIAVKPDQPLEDLDKSIEMDVFLGKITLSLTIRKRSVLLT
jgi:magnesium transporter